MNHNNPFSRREFLKKTMVASAAVAGFPAIIPGRALGADGTVAPSNRIVMGAIGVGGQGNADLKSLMNFPQVQVVAVCDVDRVRRRIARDNVDGFYGERAAGGSWKGCAEYNDFRELLAREDIDIVTNATPDHWHALISIAAVRAGKDVYCQKPATLTIEEGQRMIEEVRRYGRVLQVGSQQRSIIWFRRACELVRNGRIGKLESVVCAIPGSPESEPQPVMPVPESLDYKMWLGQAPWAPYTERRVHYFFRYNYDYSGGKLTDWGAHHIDTAHWGMDADGSGPVYVEATGDFPTEGIYNTAKSFDVTAKYGDGVTLKVVTQDHERPNGITFYGSEGEIFINRGAFVSKPEGLVRSKIGPHEIHLYESRDHYENFLDCVRTRSTPITPIEIGHRSIAVAHLANISMRLGRGLNWDPERERFVGDEEADSMIGRAMRAPWSL